MKTALELARHNAVWIVGGVLLLGILSFVLLGKKESAPAGLYEVQLGPLEQSVIFVGTVEPQERVSLGFERAGRVERIYKESGEEIERGELIANLVADEPRAALLVAQAELEREKARLVEIRGGTRAEEIVVSAAEVESSQVAERDARSALVTALSSAFTSSDAMVHTYADALFESPETLPQFTYNTPSLALQSELEALRIQVKSDLDDWAREIEEIQAAAGRAEAGSTRRATLLLQLASVLATLTDPLSDESLDSAIKKARTRMSRIDMLFDKLASAVSTMRTTGELSTSAADTFAANISTGRTSVQTALTALDTTHQKYGAAVTAREVAEANFALLEAGSTMDEIELQERVVEAERARVEAAQAELAKYILRSPLSGVMVSSFVEEGEIVSVGAEGFIMDSVGRFEIDSRVSELDVVSLREGAEGVVTLDAYGPSVEFRASVDHIEPSATSEDGIEGYGVTLVFDETDGRLRAGLTANIEVKVVLKESTFSVPARYVDRRGGEVFVQLWNGERLEERKVQGGVTLPGGMVEVLEGVSEGDMIVPYEEG